MLFKDEMWIRHPRLCVRPMGAINLAPTVGGVNADPTVGGINAAPTVGRGPIYRAHAPAPFMGEGSPTGPMIANTTLQNLFMKRVYHTIRSPGDAQRVTLSSELSGNIQVRACVLYDKRKKRL
jgi:hypothetical protein